MLGLLKLRSYVPYSIPLALASYDPVTIMCCWGGGVGFAKALSVLRGFPYEFRSVNCRLTKGPLQFRVTTVRVEGFGLGLGDEDSEFRLAKGPCRQDIQVPW